MGAQEINFEPPYSELKLQKARKPIAFSEFIRKSVPPYWLNKIEGSRSDRTSDRIIDRSGSNTSKNNDIDRFFN